MSVQKKPSVVVIGGGTGMPVLLRGLKKYPIELSALVTVADDGGSTGRLRSAMDIPATGDIRNVIASLSEVEPMLIELFQHRFEKGNGLSGHSLGNLLLAAISTISGDFYKGIREISRVFNVKGNIYPISNRSMTLHARLKNGTVISGESNIPNAESPIDYVFITPENVEPLPEAVRAIKEADLIVISPGSLYTSILPNIIIPHIKEAIQQTNAHIAYVCNVMTQAGETTGYTASDHVQAIFDHIGDHTIHSIIVHNETISEKSRKLYAKENATLVKYDLDQLRLLGLQIIEDDIIDHKESTLRHDTDKVAKLLYAFLCKEDC